MKSRFAAKKFPQAQQFVLWLFRNFTVALLRPQSGFPDLAVLFVVRYHSTCNILFTFYLILLIHSMATKHPIADPYRMRDNPEIVKNFCQLGKNGLQDFTPRHCHLTLDGVDVCCSRQLVMANPPPL